MKSLFKKILPKSTIARLKSLRDSFTTPEKRRARTIGMDSHKFKDFMNDPEGALNLKQLELFGAMKKTRFLKESKAFIIESVFEDAYQLEKIPLLKDKNCRIIDVGGLSPISFLGSIQKYCQFLKNQQRL